MQKIRVGNNIYPDPSEEDSKRLKELLGRYGIKIQFLFDDGVEFEVPEDIEISQNVAGLDVTFLSRRSSMMLLGYSESFGCIEFVDKDFEVILEIPILE